MKTKLALLFIVAVVMAGCSSSSITHSWKSANINQNKYSRIMVVGLIQETDQNIREAMENHLVGDLNEQGYKAVSAYKEFGPKAFDNLNEAEVLNKLQNSGVDAVVTIVLLDKKREQYYVPGSVYYTPYNIYQRRFWGYYSTIYQRIYTPGYYQVDTKYFWESNFYDLGSKELLYSAQTESFDPNSTFVLAHEYGKILVKNMVKQGILIAKPAVQPE